MGQKVNPISNRLGIVRGWDSNWYGGKNFGDTILEDSKIRKYLNARLGDASISRIVIERTLRMVTITVCTARPGLIIGKGGEVIQAIQEETGATVTIDEIDGKGEIDICAPEKDKIDAAIARIKAIVAVPEVDKVYTGKVRSILEFGAFVEFLPGKDGLLHISEISWDRIESMETSGIKEGDELTVKLIEIDKKTGKFRLSMKALQPRPARNNDRPRREQKEDGEKA